VSLDPVATPDTRRVPWIAQALLGAVWTACGVVIGMSPPLSETGRGASSPQFGWLLAAFGVYIVVSGFRRGAEPPADRAAGPRHGSGREPDRRTAILLPVCGLGAGLSGVAGLWWSVVSHNVTFGAFSVATVALGVAGAPAVIDSLRRR
jgi:uncharacterized membrane protein YfcA